MRLRCRSTVLAILSILFVLVACPSTEASADRWCDRDVPYGFCLTGFIFAFPWSDRSCWEPSICRPIVLYGQGYSAPREASLKEMRIGAEGDRRASRLLGGESTTCTIALDMPAPRDGLTIELSSPDKAVSVPESVTVQEGERSATFPVTTAPATTSRTVMIAARAGGALLFAKLTVEAPQLSAFIIDFPTAGTEATGTVTLTSPAGPDGMVVTLVSGNTSFATVPASVTIPAGSTTATFTISTLPLRSAKSVAIKATAGVSKSATLKIER